MTTIHELMHVAVKGHIAGTTWAFGSDVHYADAATDIAGIKRIRFRHFNDPVSSASGYWGERLNQACGYPSHLTHKFTKYKLYAPKPPDSENPPGTIG